MVAIYRNDWELVQLFLECGANPNASSQTSDTAIGFTPLDVAVHVNDLTIIELLLDVGATQMIASLESTPDEQ